MLLLLHGPKERTTVGPNLEQKKLQGEKNNNNIR